MLAEDLNSLREDNVLKELIFQREQTWFKGGIVIKADEDFFE